MKSILLHACLGILISANAFLLFAQQSYHPQDSLRILKRKNTGESNDAAGQARFEWLRQHAPKTGHIPANMRSKELQYASTLPTQENMETADAAKRGMGLMQSVAWSLRGPYNIGGRTRALGIDVSNENVILAAGVGGGMWRSSDKGNSWTRTTTLDIMPGITSLVQDPRVGKTNTWYCGSGEIISGSQAYPVYYSFPGNGMYKSTDDGQSWFVLPSTVVSDSVDFLQPFNYVYKLAIDPMNLSEDVVLAAVPGGIERSTDGGTTWSWTLGNFQTGSLYTDICATTTGVFYAAMSTLLITNDTSRAQLIDSSSVAGIWRSTDGIHWSNITTHNWQGHSTAITLDVAQSNPNTCLVLLDAYAPPNYNYYQDTTYLWKYTFLSGDGSGSGGTWSDLSANIPYGYNSYGGYAMYIKIKPDDENTVFLGGEDIYRSTDEFATRNNVLPIDSLSYVHVDHHSLAFFPSQPNAMIAGCDGGLFMTDSNTAPIIPWSNINNGFYTTQFYRVGIDHGTPGSETIIGGMQDNGIIYTNSADQYSLWDTLNPDWDGMTCAISDTRKEYYFSGQNGYTWRRDVDANGNDLPNSTSDIFPVETPEWTNPFVLDPNNPNVMYFGGGHNLWRNSNLSQIPEDSTIDFNAYPTPVALNWTELKNTTTIDDITAISISETPPNIVFYGTEQGEIYRVDNADIITSFPTDLSSGSGFPDSAFVNCIAVDPSNANNIIVVFSNYHIQSLFYTNDGGSTWAPIGGNLEQDPDGSGNGPSCRWASILHVTNGVVYLVGTTTGLYATSQLKGMATVWLQEGASTIGNNIVDNMDVRQSDGFVAVGTHGAGVFSGNITSTVSSVGEKSLNTTDYTLLQNYPNPFDATTNVTFSMANAGMATLKVYDVFGNEVATLHSGNTPAGAQAASWDASAMPTGVYYYQLVSGVHVDTKQMILLK